MNKLNKGGGFWNPESGMSLLETVVAIGITGIVISSSLSVMSILSSNQANTQLTNQRKEIVTQIRVMALNSRSLLRSASLTKEGGAAGLQPTDGTSRTYSHFGSLSACLPEAPDSGCDRSGMDDATKGNFFYLVDGSATALDQAVAGEEVYYSATGRRCTQTEAANSNSCPVFAKTWFEPFCSNFDTACNKALSLTVKYAVGVRGAYTKGPVLPALSGEVFVPLQKGIQIAGVLNQNNTPLAPNNVGIFSVEKYIGYPGQTTSGLRFKVLVTNATSLTKMRLQVRSVSGTAAYGLSDQDIPSAILSAAWSNVTSFSDITLNPYLRNTTYVFSSSLGWSTSWPIAGNYSMNASNQLIAPAFKSGFYQFRVIADTDAHSTVESSNYASVRVLPKAEQVSNLLSLYDRDCRSGTSTVPITYFLADDEGLASGAIETSASPAGYTPPSFTQPSISGHSTSYQGTLDIPRDSLAGPYTYKFTAANFFSTSIYSRLTTLREVPVSWSIADYPQKVRLNKSIDVSSSYTSGSCCNVTPSVDWTYPAVSEAAGNKMLDGAASSSLDCSLSGNSRICTTSLTVTGKFWGPTLASNDLIGKVQLGTSPPAACTVSPWNNTYGRYLQVVGAPTIAFHQPESLWLNIPASEKAPSAVQSYTPTVRLRVDFPPNEDVQVQVVKSGSSTPVCGTLTFTAGTGYDPVDLSCTLPAGDSGDFVIQRVSETIANAGDTPTTATIAVLATGKIQHRACHADLTANINFPPLLTVPATLPMTMAPWGSSVTTNQDQANWNAADQKKLRCYDNWGSGGPPLSQGTPAWFNQQDDFYSVERNYEVNVKTNAAYLRRYFSNWPISFPDFTFPYNDASGNPTFDADNVPTLFVVSKGNLSPYSWSVSTGTGSGSTSAASNTNQAFTDRTGEFCAGGSALSTIKLSSLKFRGTINGAVVMRGVGSGAFTSSNLSQMGYSFVCTYGRWNPIGQTSSPTVQ